MDVKMLKELGLDKAAGTLDKKLKLKSKLAIAYEHFRFVEPHIFDRFQEAIKAKTLKFDKNSLYGTYDTLSFVNLKEYPEVPPMDCLMDLKKAQDMGCFDSFEVASIKTVEVRPDPIIFGLVDGCVDKFYITQWDHDVKIEDILKESEG